MAHPRKQAEQRSHQVRSRSQRIMRYMFRVRPCIYCFLFECLFCALMLILIPFSFIWVGNEVVTVERLLRENTYLKEQEQYLKFMKCRYQKPTAYDARGCAENEDGYDFIFREQKLATDKMKNCVDRKDLIPCDFGRTIRFNITRLSNFSQCAGLNQIRLSRHITQYTPIIAPSVNIAEYKGKILRVKDFMVRCPKCGLKSFFGSRGAAKDSKCSREIQTYELGWPQHARFCDLEDLHDVQDFCRLYRETEQVLKAKRISVDEDENQTDASGIEELRIRGQITNIRNLN